MKVLVCEGTRGVYVRMCVYRSSSVCVRKSKGQNVGMCGGGQCGEACGRTGAE